MTAASFWSLLEPAFKNARENNALNSHLNFVLIIIGFLLGALFVYMTDLLLPSITSKQVFQMITNKKNDECKLTNHQGNSLKINSVVRSRLKRNENVKNKIQIPVGDSPMEENKGFSTNNDEQTRWHRLVLLIIAVTVHNFPGLTKFDFVFEINGEFLEGLAVGVGFGSISSSNNPTLAFNQAR
jgi:zinc transporter ZupT